MYLRLQCTNIYYWVHGIAGHKSCGCNTSLYTSISRGRRALDIRVRVSLLLDALIRLPTNTPSLVLGELLVALGPIEINYVMVCSFALDEFYWQVIEIPHVLINHITPILRIRIGRLSCFYIHIVDTPIHRRVSLVASWYIPLHEYGA